MPLAPLPPTAAWRHHETREGFELVTFSAAGGLGATLRGQTTGRNDDDGGTLWAITYELVVDPAGLTRAARVTSRHGGGDDVTELVGDGAGHWLVDGERRPSLDGCLDVDLQASGVTNALPARRLLRRGERAVTDAPAVYVRAGAGAGLRVERIEQTYELLTAAPLGAAHAFAYEAPEFDFSTQITFDAAGLTLDYPYIARRADGPAG